MCLKAITDIHRLSTSRAIWFAERDRLKFKLAFSILFSHICRFCCTFHRRSFLFQSTLIWKQISRCFKFAIKIEKESEKMLACKIDEMGEK